MAEDKDSGNTFFGRPRRSSFVPPAEENADFVPILPAVGSTPIPAAADVNYFPTVETGQPSLREPEPPARLVVPNRTSMTEEEIANAFAEAADMSSAEQIAMLDAQMTLREADLRTALSFVETLRTANPRDAGPLLDELKAKFADVGPEISELTLGFDAPSATVAPDSETLVSDAAGSVVEVTAPSTASVVETPNSAEPTDSVAGRYRLWNVVINLAVAVAALVPVSSSVLTLFGSYSVVSVETLIGTSGVVVIVAAILVSIPLVAVARTTATRHALSVRGSLERIGGRVGGATLSLLFGVFLLSAFVGLLVATSQGVGLQLSSIPGVASALSSVAPQAHITVLVVSLLVFVGFSIAALPYRIFRAKILALSGFVVAGPAIVLVTNLAVVANSNSNMIASPDMLLLATGIIPMVFVLLVGAETGIGAVVRRDEKKLHGLWLYIGLALGMAFAAWVLLSGMTAEEQGSLFVGSNPALHLQAANTETAFLLGAVTFCIPIVFLSSLVGRTLMAMAGRGERDNIAIPIRVGVALLPAILFALDFVGLVGDPATVLPGIAFLSVPIVVIVGLTAGASIASRRTLSTGARVANVIIALVVTSAGLALTLWAVPALAPLYETVLAPVASGFGLAGATLLAVPALILALSFLISLIVSAFGARRSNVA